VSAARDRSWRRFFAALTEGERRDVREILAEDYTTEIPGRLSRGDPPVEDAGAFGAPRRRAGARDVKQLVPN